ncbi:axial regulator YABBY 5-like isoform X1 [Chenopodium quinoa]|uniref:axial regulator YABBY 5-like isoform X1 n=2 Tax=Chenopodium quinoa TaxID=63459 RepID=UPI000B799C00|nr:axial regulator YABBY 5-like isoform X1 [Chenopodium quinoa]
MSSTSCVDQAAVAPPSSEQLCYIPCNYCNIVLAVSVPCNNLFDIVTVRCGHCTNLWSVNMAAAFHSLSASWQQHQQQNFHQAPNNGNMGEYRIDNLGSSSKCNYTSKAATTMRISPPISNNSSEERVINRPPEKRQRVPSAYNQFIKEEIQRIKANNPDISHREAFSTAAKNWAHFPHIHFGLMLETNNQPKLDEGSQKHLMPRTALLNN